MGGQPGPTAGSVGNVLEHALATEPQHEALVSADTRLSYEELDQAVDRAAAALGALGLRRDDVVAVSLPNASDIVVTFHAVMRLGAVWLGVTAIGASRSTSSCEIRERVFSWHHPMSCRPSDQPSMPPQRKCPTSP